VLRLRAALTQAALAKQAGVSLPTIMRGEKGDVISTGSARRLAEALGVAPAQLMEPA
jgi:transcriptional regulator with XRE-family HTH domain